MQNSALRQSLALFATEVTDIRPAASWPFGLVLLGLAVVLIATAAGFPDFFAAGLGQFGVEAP